MRNMIDWFIDENDLPIIYKYSEQFNEKANKDNKLDIINN